MKLFKRKLSFSAFMPASACCTSCRTKYTFLTKEVGCPGCGLSFCKKCLSYKAHVPRVREKLADVCYDCYQKAEAAKIKSNMLPSKQVNQSSIDVSSSTQNWWGEGLPPPSFRQTLGKYPVTVQRPIPSSDSEIKNINDHNEIKNLEDKIAELKKQDVEGELPSVSNIEERLAALRGCDVEMIRNPRAWFTSTESTLDADSADSLFEQAKNLAAIEERFDPDKELIDRVKKLHEKEETIDDIVIQDGNRFSTVSNTDSLNQDEKAQFDKMLNEAEQHSKVIKEQDKAVDDELKHVMKLTRQKSQDINKINSEFTNFWDKQINKTMEMSESEEDEVDDEIVKKIVQEAEAAPDHPESSTQPPIDNNEPKKGIFGKIFRR